MNLVIFDLPAVVNYDHLPLRQCLIRAVGHIMGKEPALESINWNGNCTGKVMELFRKTIDRLPTLDEYQQVKKVFLEELKLYFIHSEESFEVWPGVQNIFESIARKRDWEYFIISDYWADDTRFILDSCGVYTKRLKLFTADDAISSQEIISKILERYPLSERESLYVLSDHIDMSLFSAFNNKVKKMRPPRRNLANVLEYPRFSKLFIS